MFAVIKTGGKQYKVDVEIKEVLLVGEGDNVKVGTPVVEGATVVATVKEHGKGDKKINFKYNKKTYYRKKGHRQSFTTIEVKSINA